MEPISLIYVDENNHNKFYTLRDLENGSFKAEWGRVGSAGQSAEFPLSQWEAKLRDKLRKGYVEITKTSPSSPSGPNVKIPDPQVQGLIKTLILAAKTAVEASYQVAAGEVTPEQTAGAQALLNQAWGLLKEGRAPREALNSLLKDLYRVIPRRMPDTRKYFLQEDSPPDFALKLLQAEQNLLDTLESQIKKYPEEITLQALGLDILPASQDDKKRIAQQTDFKVARQKIFRVSNKITEKAFKTETPPKLLYHGTRNSNWLSVLQKGLIIRPAGVQTTGSMFGDAIYFASRARKSLGYTSLKGSYWASGTAQTGYLALFEVNTGKEWNLLQNQPWQNWMTKLNAQEVTRQGYDSVFAKGGADLKNDEYVIYDASRCTIRYLIEINKVN
jgi:poly [ADP-ribose] polymerase